MDKKTVKQKLSDVETYEKKIETARSAAADNIDKALKDCQAGKISLQKANEIIEAQQQIIDNFDPAGSCPALTAARVMGQFMHKR